MSQPQPLVDYFSGLDLGQASDYSALVVTERTRATEHATAAETRYAVRHIHRWHLGTSYTQIAAELKEMYAVPPLAGTVLAIDRTGVGRGVCDMIRDSGLSARCRPFTITAGSRPGPGTVPKKDLVAAIQVPLQSRSLQFAEELPLTQTLATELEHFRVKVTADRNESFESWRERDHDDLVLALALALHVGRVGAFAFSVGTVSTPVANKPKWVF